MKIYFITTNKHKVLEAQSIMKEFEIDIIQLDEEKYEPKEMSLKEVTIYNAKKFYEIHKKPIVVEDTGIFFDAYLNFPGTHPKLVFNMIGYKGILKLIKNENKNAHFKSVLSYYDGQELKTFEGKLNGKISTEIHDKDLDVLPYERIFLYNNIPISSIPRIEKNKISHRSKAFIELGKWLKTKNWE